MANYLAPADVVAQMVADFEDITGITLDPNDMSREEVIKMWTYAGAISSFYSSLVQTEDNIWPASANTQGLQNHLAADQLPAQIQPQASNGVLKFPGTEGVVLPIGSIATRKLDGSQYISTAAATVDGTGYVQANFQSLIKGQAANVQEIGDEYDLSSPPTGITAAGVSASEFADGRDLETPAEMLARIQAAEQDENTGGNLVAYEAMAKAASPDVVTAVSIKNPRGAGTVNTVITSGTTDVAAAVNAGLPVVRIPSTDLINAVQAYIIENNPTTDDHLTVAPTETSFGLTFTYNLYDETLRASVDVQLRNLISIYVYSAKPGDVLAPSDLEKQIDAAVGFLMSYRRVSDLGSGSPFFTVPNSQLLKPGTITLAGPTS